MSFLGNVFTGSGFAPLSNQFFGDAGWAVNPVGMYRDSVIHGADPASENFASDTRARIARAEWEDYKQRYMPIEMGMLDMYNNRFANTRQAMGEAQGYVNKSFPLAENAYQRQLGSFGVQLTPEQQASHGRQMKVAQGLATVDAANQTRRRMVEMNNQLVSGSSPRQSMLGNAATNNTGGG